MAITFDPNTRKLTGEAANTGTFKLIYKADAEGVDAITQEIGLKIGLVLTWDAQQSDLSFDTSQTLNVQLPTATRNPAGTVTYSLTGLPSSLSFNANTRRITGRPNVSGTFNLVYTADADDVDAITQEITLSLSASLSWARMQVDLSFDTSSVVNVRLPLARRRPTGTIVYTLVGLPSGLSFNANTRRVTGTPTMEGEFTLTYTASSSGTQFITQSITLSVGAILTWASQFDDFTVATDEVVSIALPLATRDPTGTVTYALAGLPAGLSFVAATRRITGTPTVEGDFNLTYTASSVGATDIIQTIVVTAEPTVSWNAQQADLAYSIGDTLNVTLPAATRLPTGNITYSITGLPSQTPIMQWRSEQADLTYTTEDEVDITLPDFISSPVLDTTYSLESADFSSNREYLPAGLSFDPVTRKLTGTPNIALAFALRLRATFQDGTSRTQEFDLTTSDTANTTSHRIYGYSRVIIARVRTRCGWYNEVWSRAAPIPAAFLSRSVTGEVRIRSVWIGSDGQCTLRLGKEATFTDDSVREDLSDAVESGGEITIQLMGPSGSFSFTWQMSGWDASDPYTGSRPGAADFQTAIDHFLSDATDENRVSRGYVSIRK